MLKIILTIWGLKTLWYLIGIQSIKHFNKMQGLTLESNPLKELLLAVIYPDLFFIGLTVVVLFLYIVFNSILSEPGSE